MDYDDFKPKLAALRERTNEQMERIRSDGASFGEAWRDRAMASVHRKAQQEANSMLEHYVTDRNARRSRLREDLFGLPANASADERADYRDARQRAQSLDRGKAFNEMKDAIEMGDRVYARAIAKRAVDEYMPGVIDAYREGLALRGDGDELVSVADKLEKLADLPRPSKDGDGNYENLSVPKGVDKIAFGVFPPAELKNYNSYTRDRLADEFDAGETSGGEVSAS